MEDRAFYRKCIVEELMCAQTTPDRDLRAVHLGLVSLYEERLLALRESAKSSRS